MLSGGSCPKARMCLGSDLTADWGLYVWGLHVLPVSVWLYPHRHEAMVKLQIGVSVCSFLY